MKFRKRAIIGVILFVLTFFSMCTNCYCVGIRRTKKQDCFKSGLCDAGVKNKFTNRINLINIIDGNQEKRQSSNRTKKHSMIRRKSSKSARLDDSKVRNIAQQQQQKISLNEPQFPYHMNNAWNYKEQLDEITPFENYSVTSRKIQLDFNKTTVRLPTFGSSQELRESKQLANKLPKSWVSGRVGLSAVATVLAFVPLRVLWAVEGVVVAAGVASCVVVCLAAWLGKEENRYFMKQNERRLKDQKKQVPERERRAAEDEKKQQQKIECQRQITDNILLRWAQEEQGYPAVNTIGDGVAIKPSSNTAFSDYERNEALSVHSTHCFDPYSCRISQKSQEKENLQCFLRPKDDSSFASYIWPCSPMIDKCDDSDGFSSVDVSTESDSETEKQEKGNLDPDDDGEWSSCSDSELQH